MDAIEIANHWSNFQPNSTHFAREMNRSSGSIRRWMPRRIHPEFPLPFWFETLIKHQRVEDSSNAIWSEVLSRVASSGFGSSSRLRIPKNPKESRRWVRERHHQPIPILSSISPKRIASESDGRSRDNNFISRRNIRGESVIFEILRRFITNSIRTPFIQINSTFFFFFRPINSIRFQFPRRQEMEGKDFK